MPKTVRWSLALVSVLALGVSFLVLDLQLRADAALAAHEALLRADIDALRYRRHPPLLLSGLDFSMPVLERFPCPFPAWQGLGGPYPMFERGHGGQVSTLSLAGFDLKRVHPPRRTYAEEAVTALAMTQHVLREGGYDAALCREHHDSMTLGTLLFRVFEHPDTEIAELRWLSIALDQLMAARPSAEDILAGESVLDRAEVLNVLRGGDDPRGIFKEGPGWRELFSRNILAVKILNRLEEHHRKALEFCSTPTPQWQRIREGLPDPRAEPHLAWSFLRSGAFEACINEQEDLDEWMRCRIWTAIALFLHETGCEPAELTDLVPVYLPEVPLSPRWGKPYELQDGELKVQGIEEPVLIL